MSDNKKLKKAIRARMAQNDESYTTARMHILAKLGKSDSKGRFERVLEGTIERAAAARSAYVKRMQVPITEGPGATERLLRAHLEGLHPEDLRRVEVLMYAGRDGEDIIDLASELPRDTHEITVHVVASKLPVLEEYLTKGLALAKEQGVDLDAGFEVAS